MTASKLLPKKTLAKNVVNFEKLPFQKLIFISIALNIIAIGLIITLKNKLPPEVPLFFGLAQGEAQLKPSLSLAIPGIIALAITILNTSISLVVRDEYLRKILISTSFAVSTLSIITIVKILLLVGNFKV